MKILAAPFDEILGIKRIGANVAKMVFHFYNFANLHRFGPNSSFLTFSSKFSFPIERKKKLFLGNIESGRRLKDLKEGRRLHQPRRI